MHTAGNICRHCRLNAVKNAQISGLEHVIVPPEVCPLHFSTVIKPTPPTIIRMTPGNDPFETQTKVFRESQTQAVKPA